MSLIPSAPFAVSGPRGDTDWPWRGELHTLGFNLLPLSAIFRASYRNPDEANAFGERLSPVMDELNLPLAA